MRRVVITGLGIVSPIGNNAEEVTESLKAGRSGIAAQRPQYSEAVHTRQHQIQNDRVVAVALEKLQRSLAVRCNIASVALGLETAIQGLRQRFGVFNDQDAHLFLRIKVTLDQKNRTFWRANLWPSF